MIRTRQSETPAAQRLRIFLERIERLDEERKTLADDIAEVYKELTDDGFDKDAAKVVLKIRKNADALAVWTTRSLTVDTYLSALGMLPEALPAPAPARTYKNIEQFPPHDAVTGEIIEHHSSAPPPPETTDTTEALTPQASVAPSHAEPVAEQDSTVGPAPSEQVGAPIPEPFEPPAFLVKAAKPLRPLCLNPDECAGYGTHTCHRCLKAAGKTEVAA